MRRAYNEVSERVDIDRWPCRHNAPSDAAGPAVYGICGPKLEIRMAARHLAVVDRGDTGWTAHVPDLPACSAVGNTGEEVLRLIREAIEVHIEGLRRDGLPVPQ
jgi:predicted RNase H-like HicB family nuclease